MQHERNMTLNDLFISRPRIGWRQLEDLVLQQMFRLRAVETVTQDSSICSLFSEDSISNATLLGVPVMQNASQLQRNTNALCSMQMGQHPLFGLPDLARSMTPLLAAIVHIMQDIQSNLSPTDAFDLIERKRDCKRLLSRVYKQSLNLESQLHQYINPGLVTSLQKRSARATNQYDLIIKLIQKLRKESRKACYDHDSKRRACQISTQLKSLLSQQKCEWQCVGRLKETLSMAKEITALLGFICKLSSMIEKYGDSLRSISERPPPYEYRSPYDEFHQNTSSFSTCDNLESSDFTPNVAGRLQTSSLPRQSQSEITMSLTFDYGESSTKHPFCKPKVTSVRGQKQKADRRESNTSGASSSRGSSMDKRKSRSHTKGRSKIGSFTRDSAQAHGSQQLLFCKHWGKPKHRAKHSGEHRDKTKRKHSHPKYLIYTKRPKTSSAHHQSQTSSKSTRCTKSDCAQCDPTPRCTPQAPSRESSSGKCCGRRKSSQKKKSLIGSRVHSDIDSSRVEVSDCRLGDSSAKSKVKEKLKTKSKCSQTTRVLLDIDSSRVEVSDCRLGYSSAKSKVKEKLKTKSKCSQTTRVLSDIDSSRVEVSDCRLGDSSAKSKVKEKLKTKSKCSQITPCNCECCRKNHLALDRCAHKTMPQSGLPCSVSKFYSPPMDMGNSISSSQPLLISSYESDAREDYSESQGTLLTHDSSNNKYCKGSSFFKSYKPDKKRMSEDDRSDSNGNTSINSLDLDCTTASAEVSCMENTSAEFSVRNCQLSCMNYTRKSKNVGRPKIHKSHRPLAQMPLSKSQQWLLLKSRSNEELHSFSDQAMTSSERLENMCTSLSSGTSESVCHNQSSDSTSDSCLGSKGSSDQNSQLIATDLQTETLSISSKKATSSTSCVSCDSKPLDLESEKQVNYRTVSGQTSSRKPNRDAKHQASSRSSFTKSQRTPSRQQKTPHCVLSGMSLEFCSLNTCSQLCISCQKSSRQSYLHEECSTERQSCFLSGSPTKRSGLLKAHSPQVSTTISKRQSKKQEVEMSPHVHEGLADRHSLQLHKRLSRQSYISCELKDSSTQCQSPVLSQRSSCVPESHPTMYTQRQPYVPEECLQQKQSQMSSQRQSYVPEECSQQLQSQMSSQRQSYVPEECSQQLQSQMSSQRQSYVPEECSQQLQSQMSSQRESYVPEECLQQLQPQMSSQRQSYVPKECLQHFESPTLTPRQSYESEECLPRTQSSMTSPRQSRQSFVSEKCSLQTQSQILSPRHFVSSQPEECYVQTRCPEVCSRQSQSLKMSQRQFITPCMVEEIVLQTPSPTLSPRQMISPIMPPRKCLPSYELEECLILSPSPTLSPKQKESPTLPPRQLSQPDEPEECLIQIRPQTVSPKQTKSPTYLLRQYIPSSETEECLIQTQSPKFSPRQTQFSTLPPRQLRPYESEKYSMLSQSPTLSPRQTQSPTLPSRQLRQPDEPEEFLIQIRPQTVSPKQTKSPTLLLRQYIPSDETEECLIQAQSPTFSPRQTQFSTLPPKQLRPSNESEKYSMLSPSPTLSPRETQSPTLPPRQLRQPDEPEECLIQIRPQTVSPKQTKSPILLLRQYIPSDETEECLIQTQSPTFSPRQTQFSTLPPKQLRPSHESEKYSMLSPSPTLSPRETQSPTLPPRQLRQSDEPDECVIHVRPQTVSPKETNSPTLLPRQFRPSDEPEECLIQTQSPTLSPRQTQSPTLPPRQLRQLDDPEECLMQNRSLRLSHRQPDESEEYLIQTHPLILLSQRQSYATEEINSTVTSSSLGASESQPTSPINSPYSSENYNRVPSETFRKSSTSPQKLSRHVSSPEFRSALVEPHNSPLVSPKPKPPEAVSPLTISPKQSIVVFSSEFIRNLSQQLQPNTKIEAPAEETPPHVPTPKKSKSPIKSESPTTKSPTPADHFIGAEDTPSHIPTPQISKSEVKIESPIARSRAPSKTEYKTQSPDKSKRQNKRLFRAPKQEPERESSFRTPEQEPEKDLSEEIPVQLQSVRRPREATNAEPLMVEDEETTASEYHPLVLPSNKKGCSKYWFLWVLLLLFLLSILYWFICSWTRPECSRCTLPIPNIFFYPLNKIRNSVRLVHFGPTPS